MKDVCIANICLKNDLAKQNSQKRNMKQMSLICLSLQRLCQPMTISSLGLRTTVQVGYAFSHILSLRACVSTYSIVGA
jgi:hypothetical protein